MSKEAAVHVSISFLRRDPSTISFPSNDDPAVIAAIEDDSGWVGNPDPTKYAAITDLSPRELKEEIDKGNVMLWKVRKTVLCFCIYVLLDRKSIV